MLLCWGIRIPAPVQFCRVVERSCEKPVLLITVDTSTSQVQAVSCAGENLSCQNLRMPGWSQMDELVWGSDLIFCTRRDIAHRAMEAGTPMLWMHDDDGLFDWYLDGQDPAFKRSLNVVAYHLQQVGTPSSELLWLLNQREFLESIARNAVAPGQGDSPLRRARNKAASRATLTLSGSPTRPGACTRKADKGTELAVGVAF